MFARLSSHRFLSLAAVLLALLVASAHAAPTEAETAAWSLARSLEKEGFAFRAESWQKELKPEMGKAVRVQLFKGNDYRFCVAVPAKSGVQINATVLDGAGKQLGETRPVEAGWGLVIAFKPKHTGVYAIAISQLKQGNAKPVPCALLTGFQ